MLKLDKVERAILCALDCNSRRSLSSIGKSVRLKKESVHYRIQQLEKRNIIQGYPAIISLAKIGKIHAEIFLRFHNVTVGLKKEMIDFFIKQHDIVYVTSCKGNWDLLLGIVVDNIGQLYTLKNAICNVYSMYLADISLSFTIETYFYGRKYLMGKDIHIKKHIDQPGMEKLDKVDEKILSCISRNSKANLLEIARVVKTSPKVVSYRIKKMEKNKIIQKYTVYLNTNTLDMTSFKLLLRLKSVEHKRRFLEYFHRQPNTVNVREVLSNWNLEPTFEVESPEQFYEIIKELEEKFGESIMSHTSLILDEVYKSNYYY